MIFKELLEMFTGVVVFAVLLVSAVLTLAWLLGMVPPVHYYMCTTLDGQELAGYTTSFTGPAKGSTGAHVFLDLEDKAHVVIGRCEVMQLPSTLSRELRRAE